MESTIYNLKKFNNFTKVQKSSKLHGILHIYSKYPKKFSKVLIYTGNNRIYVYFTSKKLNTLIFYTKYQIIRNRAYIIGKYKKKQNFTKKYRNIRNHAYIFGKNQKLLNFSEIFKNFMKLSVYIENFVKIYFFVNFTWICPYI